MILVNTSDMCDPEQRKIAEQLKLRYEMRHNDKKKPRSVNTFLIPREIAVLEGLTLRDNDACLVPCGRCIGCRLDYSREWAIRCMKEVEQYDHNYFLTLDYDDVHLPIGFCKDGPPTATLVPDHVSEFMKRLRTKLQREYGFTGVRFFACGEYGDQSNRPHLHIILINCPLQDLQEKHPIPVDGVVKWIRQYDSSGEQLMYSPLVASCWVDEKGVSRGRSPIGQVTFESCAYVARYIVKKQYGEGAEIYEKLGIVPEFVRMSRNPGIGYNFFIENMESIYKYDNFSIRRGDEVINVKPGRYADKLLKLKHEQLYYDRKKKRRVDFYDSVDTKDFDAVDVRLNNERGEYNKLHSVRQLKRGNI